MMEEKYTFDINPINCQPSGHCNFEKIYNPKTAIITWTNLNTLEKETHIIKRKTITKNDTDKFIYILPSPFAKKDEF